MKNNRALKVHPAIDAQRNPPPGRAYGGRPPVGSPLHDSNLPQPVQMQRQSGSGSKPKPQDIADIADTLGAHA